VIDFDAGPVVLNQPDGRPAGQEQREEDDQRERGHQARIETGEAQARQPEQPDQGAKAVHLASGLPCAKTLYALSVLLLSAPAPSADAGSGATSWKPRPRTVWIWAVLPES